VRLMDHQHMSSAEEIRELLCCSL